MRSTVIVMLVCAVTSVAAKPVADKKPKPLDLSAVLDKLDVYKDELGNFYVAPKVGAFADTKDQEKHLFYGDGKAMYQQRVIGHSSQGNQVEWYLWSPRAKQMTAAELHLDPANLYLECRRKDGKRKLDKLDADEAATLLGKVKFYPPRWERQAHYLARDDEGVYYFVDQLREDLGGQGYRVFAGMKGAMKQLPMTNMASDSAGEIFATKSGQLKIVANKEGQAFWIKGGKKVELTVLPLYENRYLIYRELGIYGQLGTACEDQ